MLFVISDLHFTDGTTSHNIKAKVFSDILLPEISNNVQKRNATEIRIVLLGDIFDLVRTDYWEKNVQNLEDRPWGGTLDEDTAINVNSNSIEAQFSTVLDDVLNHPSTKEFIKMINKIAARFNNHYTKLTYVVGNHDRVLWNFPSLQDKIRAKFDAVTNNGTNNDRVEFLNVLYTPEYGVIGRHGHEWDEICHGWEFYNQVLHPDEPVQRFDMKAYETMAVGEVITAELMSGLIYRLTQDSRINNDIEFIASMKDINNVRPMLEVFRWIDWFMKRNLSNDYKKAIYSALEESLDSLLNTSFAKKWDDMSVDLIIKGDVIDRLQLLDKVLQNSNYDKIKRTILKIMPVLDIFSGDSDPYEEGAQKEWEWIDSEDLKKVEYIVYGHTHQSKQVYFNGTPNYKVRSYINTGTYLPLIIGTKDKKGFASARQMTMLFFYNENEDLNDKKSGPSMEVWNGIRRKLYE